MHQPLCCPIRDRELICGAGLLPGRSRRDSGHDDGEEGGPVMTWRDPFIFFDDQQQLHLFWAAKSKPTHGVIAHALVEQTSDGYQMVKLLPAGWFT